LAKPGATNAGILAAQMIALADSSIAKKLEATKRSGARSGREIEKIAGLDKALNEIANYRHRIRGKSSIHPTPSPVTIDPVSSKSAIEETSLDFRVVCLLEHYSVAATTARNYVGSSARDVQGTDRSVAVGPRCGAYERLCLGPSLLI